MMKWKLTCLLLVLLCRCLLLSVAMCVTGPHVIIAVGAIGILKSIPSILLTITASGLWVLAFPPSLPIVTSPPFLPGVAAPALWILLLESLSELSLGMHWRKAIGCHVALTHAIPILRQNWGVLLSRYTCMITH